MKRREITANTPVITSEFWGKVDRQIVPTLDGKYLVVESHPTYGVFMAWISYSPEGKGIRLQVEVVKRAWVDWRLKEKLKRKELKAKNK